MHVAASRLTTGEKGRPVSSDKDEVTSSILVSPTRTSASAGVLLFSWGFPAARVCMSSASLTGRRHRKLPEGRSHNHPCGGDWG